MELLSIAGVSHPDQIGPFHVQKRISPSEVSTLDEVYEFLKPGALLSLWPWLVPVRYRKFWKLAKAEEPFEQSLAKRVNATGPPRSK